MKAGRSSPWVGSRQGQFGRDQQLRTCGVSAAGGVDNAPRVARQVADGGVDLSQRNLDHVGACN
jgi:hypothetical protein